MASAETSPRIYPLTDCDVNTIGRILRSERESYSGEIDFVILGAAAEQRVNELASSLMLQRPGFEESWFLQRLPGDDFLLRFPSGRGSPVAGTGLPNTDKRSPTTKTSVVATEPRVAKGIASLLLPRKHRTTFLGDLHEDYRSVEREQGPRSAKWWYRKEVAKEVFPSLWNLCVWPALRKLVSEAVKQLIGG